jgi:hypothetical protein
VGFADPDRARDQLLADDPDSQEALAGMASTLATVGNRIAEGDHEGAARQFTDEVIFEPSAWEQALPPEVKAIMVGNAPRFLDRSATRTRMRSTAKRSPAWRFQRGSRMTRVARRS